MNGAGAMFDASVFSRKNELDLSIQLLMSAPLDQFQTARLFFQDAFRFYRLLWERKSLRKKQLVVNAHQLIDATDSLLQYYHGAQCLQLIRFNVIMQLHQISLSLQHLKQALTDNDDVSFEAMNFAYEYQFFTPLPSNFHIAFAKRLAYEAFFKPCSNRTSKYGAVTAMEEESIIYLSSSARRIRNSLKFLLKLFPTCQRNK